MHQASATHLVVRETPDSLFYQGLLRKYNLAKSNELGYGNNEKDWATRMLTT